MRADTDRAIADLEVDVQHVRSTLERIRLLLVHQPTPASLDHALADFRGQLKTLETTIAELREEFAHRNDKPIEWYAGEIEVGMRFEVAHRLLRIERVEPLTMPQEMIAIRVVAVYTTGVRDIFSEREFRRRAKVV